MPNSTRLLAPVAHAARINWDLIAPQYDEMVKFAVGAFASGNRGSRNRSCAGFTRANATASDLSGAPPKLGKAIKTIFSVPLPE